MSDWLCQHFDGIPYGDHHDFILPEEARDYLVFTIVRNPYERVASKHFHITWGDTRPRTKPGNERVPLPVQSDTSIERRVRARTDRNISNKPAFMTQKRFTDLSRIDLALYFERFPHCLNELPFVSPDNIPDFPHHPERAIRPAKDFFELFDHTDEEQVVWAHAEDDFELFAYQRFNSGLPETAPNAIRLR